MEKRADFTDMLQALVEPLIRKWLARNGLMLGEFYPSRNILDVLDEQQFEDMKTQLMQTAASNDPEPMKMLKGFYTMLGQDWNPAMDQQANTIRQGYSALAPYFMRWAPGWWDTLHGGTGSVATLAAAIADAHRYDNIDAGQSVNTAEKIFDEVMDDPMKSRGFNAQDIGNIYREAAKRGYVHRGMDPKQITEEITPVLGVASAIRDSMSASGADPRDTAGIFDAMDKILPGQLGAYDWGEVESRIRMGRLLGRQGGLMSAALGAGAVGTPGPGKGSLAELEAQNKQLMRQGAESHLMDILTATSMAKEKGWIQPGSKADKMLEAAMQGQLPELRGGDWAQAMVESDATGRLTHQKALQLLNQGPARQEMITPELMAAVRANQRTWDHQRHFDVINKMFQGDDPLTQSLREGEKTNLVRQWGYRNWQHYNQLHDPSVVQGVQLAISRARQGANAERAQSPYGWKGPVRRTIDELKNPQGATPSSLGSAFINVVPKPAQPQPMAQAPQPQLPSPVTPPKMAADKRQVTVAVDLDGTLAKMYTKFDPEKIEDPRPGAKEAMELLREKGCLILINTVRGNKKLVKEWLEKHDIEFDHINFNPNQPEGASDKLIADFYVDDRSVDARPAWRKIMETLGSRVDRMKKESAIRGIPDKSNYGDVTQLQPNEIVDLFVQRHKAHRAGEHYDYRVGSPATGLYSWSMKPPRLPVPGEKRFVRRQPLHSHEYGSFSGSIGSGYGKGEVRSEIQNRVLITKAQPNKIEFTIASTGTPERFVLLRPEKWGENEWLLLNTTPKQVIPYEKVRYKTIPAEEVEPLIDQMQQGASMQAKIDGAASLIKLMRHGAEVVSYRKSKRTGMPIVHTERMFGGRPNIEIPKELVGTVLKGELYGIRDHGGKPPAVRATDEDRKGRAAMGVAGRQVQDGDAAAADTARRAIAPSALGGILNATIEHSLQKQRDRGVSLKNMVYDIQQLGKKPIDFAKTPYASRRKMVQDVVKHLPADYFHISEEATTPDEARALWSRIRGGTHPLTHEGIVIHPSVGRPMKAKQMEEADVHVTGTFPGAGKYRGRGAGGFTYSLEPGGPTIGEVGTGLSDDLREQMHRDPESFVGRVARIHAQEQFPSGAWRAPALIALHEDY